MVYSLIKTERKNVPERKLERKAIRKPLSTDMKLFSLSSLPTTTLVNTSFRGTSEDYQYTILIYCIEDLPVQYILLKTCKDCCQYKTLNLQVKRFTDLPVTGHKKITVT